MGPIFRVAEDADLDTLVGFMRRYYAFDHIPFDEAEARTAMRRLMADQFLGVVWLICDDTTPVGYVVLTFGYSLEYHGRDAFIDEVFIDPSHRARGWGRKAVRHVEDASRGFGVRALHLEVTRTNEGVRAFYRELGFADHDRYLLTRRIDQ